MQRLAGLTLLVPHIPGIMTDYFAERRAGHTLHCDGLPSDAAAPDAAACRVRAGCARPVAGALGWQACSASALLAACPRR